MAQPSSKMPADETAGLAPKTSPQAHDPQDSPVTQPVRNGDCDPYRVLDGISAAVAVVSTSGEIVVVNQVRSRFGQHSGMAPAASVGVGANDLAACLAAERRGDASTPTSRRGIELVLY
jgi:hypothetical protein